MVRVVGGRGCCCLLFTSHTTDSGPGCSNMNTQCRVDVIELYGIMRYYGKHEYNCFKIECQMRIALCQCVRSPSRSSKPNALMDE